MECSFDNEEEEAEEEEMDEEDEVYEEDDGVDVMGNEGMEPQNPAPIQGNQNEENHGFAGEELLPDPFVPEEEEDPQSDITDVDDEEPRYVIGKGLFEELIRYLHGRGGPGAGADA